MHRGWVAWTVLLTACDCGGGADPDATVITQPDGGTNPGGDAGPGAPEALRPYTGMTQASLPPNPQPPQWERRGDRNLLRIRAPEAWASTRGDPAVIIAVLDTGLDPNSPVFQGALVPGRDLVLDVDDVVDEHGHGTAIAAAIGARSSSAVPVQGVCDGCRIMPLRVSAGDVEFGAFDEMDQRLADGLRLARDRGASIAILGYAAEAFTPLTAAAVRDVVASGMVVIAPAGDDRYTAAAWPARLPEVISVAASFAEVDVATADTNGPHGVDLWAPASAEPLPDGRGRSQRASGSSLAAAYVAGVAGLLRSLHPNMSPAGVRSVLMRTAVPLLPGRRSQLRPGGRVDAREAVRAVFPAPRTDQIADLSISHARSLPERPRPGQPLRVRARIDNTGTLDVRFEDAVVRLWRGADAQWFEPPPGTLGPGGSIWIEIETVAATTLGPDPLIVEIVERPGRIIGGPGVATFPGNDAQPILRFESVAPDDLVLSDVITATATGELSHELSTTDLRIADLELLEVREQWTGDLLELAADFANAGNEPVQAGLRATLAGMEIGSLAPFEWAPGTRRTLVVTVDRATGPPSQDWSVLFESTAVDDRPDNQIFEVRAPSGLAPRFELAYGDVIGSDIIHDAPYRVQTGRPNIPVLAFVPEWRGLRSEIVCYTLWARRGHAPPPRGFYPEESRAQWNANGVRLLHIHRSSGTGPERPRKLAGTDFWTPQIVDEDGAVDGSYFKRKPALAERHGAWHRVLRVPWRVVDVAFPPGVPAQPRAIYLLSQVTIRKPNLRVRGDFVYHNYSGVLRVTQDTLAKFAGRADRYYDAHFHTIAEGSANQGYLSPTTNPAQSWAAPIAMIAESAYAHGFADAPDFRNGEMANQVITTDHNQFYSRPINGVPEDWTPGSGPTKNLDGPMEFNRMRQLFGRGAGEEVTVKGGDSPFPLLPKIGRHMLVYDADHVPGPWHGGGANSNDIDTLLGILGSDNDATPPAAYPAHPFVVFPDRTAPQWRMQDLELMLGMRPFNASKAFSRTLHPVARGFQIWNQKWVYRQEALARWDLRRADPWGVFQWDQARSSVWLDQLKFDLRRWNFLIKQGLVYEIDGASPRHRYIRKVFGVGGTDAHGDFNYMTNVSATALTNLAHGLVLRHIGGRDFLYWTNNAWGKVRTYALVESGSAEDAVAAVTVGRSIVTDGPLVRIAIDADAHLDNATLNYDLNLDATTANFDEDGRMGGGGRMDGVGTALMLLPDAEGFSVRQTEPVPYVQYVVKNPTGQESSGGALQEVGVWNLHSGANSLSRAHRCQLVRGAFADDTEYVVDLWPSRPKPWPLNTGATFAHTTTALLTDATPPFCVMAPRNIADPDQASVGVSNPVWWAAGSYTLLVDARCGATGASTLQKLQATVDFPISTSTVTGAFVQALDANGRSAGPRISTHDIAITAEDDIAGRRLTVRWDRLTLPLSPNQLSGASSGSFVVVLTGVTDAVGNVFNPVAMVRHLGTCSGGTLCCDLNPPDLAHVCFGNSRHGACASCGQGCRGDQTCRRQGPAAFACETNLGSGCVQPCFCCFNRICYDGIVPTRDDYCGACGVVCGPGQQCCGGACLPVNFPGTCGSCATSCMTGNTCCPSRFGQGCVDTNVDPTNCGECGHTCTPDEQCCSGTCVRFDDRAFCGTCSTSCTMDQRCCDETGSGASFICVAVDSDDHCGACGNSCPSGQSCDDGQCD